MQVNLLCQVNARTQGNLDSSPDAAERSSDGSAAPTRFAAERTSVAARLDTGGVIFAIDVLWSCGQPIPRDAEQAFVGVFRSLDEEVCVWVGEQDRRTPCRVRCGRGRLGAGCATGSVEVGATRQRDEGRSHD